MPGICPYCETLIQEPNVEQVTAREPLRTPWASATFMCPHCNKIIGVTFDQTVHTQKIINDIVSALRPQS